MSQQISNANKLTIVCLVVIISAMILGCAGRSNSNTTSNSTANTSTVSDADRERWRNEDALKAKEKEYTTLPKKVQLTKEPYIKGKMVFYLASPSSMELQNPMLATGIGRGEDLLKDLLAASPNEVGTVVLIGNNTKTGGCKEIPKANYKNKETGEIMGSYIESCELTIIDLSIPAVIYRKNFEGSLKETMYARKDSGGIIGRIDYPDVYSFLASLPRR
jgi:hypothetical protein